MRILYAIGGIILAYEVVAWCSRNLNRPMSDGEFWLRKASRGGVRWDGHRDIPQG